MSGTLRIVNSLPETEWRRFVMEHPAGSIFHSPEMFQVFARSKGFEPIVRAAVDDAGIPLAILLPVRISVMGGWMRALTTRAVVFGSLLCARAPRGQEALKSLLHAYTRETRDAPLFTELRNLVDLADFQPLLREAGFVYEPHLNYLVDLHPAPQAVFERIGARTRKAIRHGLNQGKVVIEVVTQREQVADCYELLSKTYRNARVPLADRSLFESAFDVLYPQGMIRYTLARVGGAYAAASVDLIYKDIVYGWYGGLDRDYGRYNPNELLTWNLLEWSSQKGYRVYDFGGAGKPDEPYPVRDFKAKFGGRLVSFGRNTFVHAPLRLRLSMLGYQLLRGFIR